MLMSITPKFSPINLLGKLFFRRRAPWEQRRKVVVLLWSVVVGVVLGGMCVAMILFQNRRR